MRLILLLGLVLALGLSAAAEKIVGAWTMAGLNKVCEDHVPVNQSGPLCTYQFMIDESAEPALPMTWCTVTAHSLDEQGINNTFYDVPCREGGVAGVYRVHSLWHRSGFTVFSVVNVTGGVYASFAYRDRDLEGLRRAPTRTEPSYELGAKTRPSDEDADMNRPHHGEGDDSDSGGGGGGGGGSRRAASIAGRRLYAGGGHVEVEACDPNVWVVRNLSRNARPVVQTVLFRFNMVRCDEVIRCKLEAVGNNPTTVDIKFDNFADVPCENRTGINVSWGYKADTDGGIMTLKDVGQRRRAFLGWDNVNSRVRIEEEASGVSEVY
ncbi:hypothetical protein GGTG_02660 [Gaeumannomyces tritici R3-111a-1]|uniref:AA1-like domain-containing protein n=1 Tax=Gaeumannomyces tritici (strain R3-111a-1) TaxID=644352 RepID=J3NN02_GAET3|nr:hypothetical protein GGTG_02660 [Gaeumannomyces tritici R3-111a-1]EJT77554.1 hypothetical protein GGTG_02660 [Gaeumannomyces tritici R3-111a-1]